MGQLNELDEIRQEALQNTILVQQQRFRWHDKYIKERKFDQGDWALLFDSKFKNLQGKFHTHCLGPYEVENVFDNGAVRIKTIDEEKSPLLVNVHRIRLYQKPLTKEEFVKIFQDNLELKMVEKNSSSFPPQKIYFSLKKKTIMYKHENQHVVGMLIHKI